MRALMRSGAAALLFALALPILAIEPAQAQEIPTLNVDPTCRGISQQAGTAGEKGGPDLAYKQCVSSEQDMRQKLTGEWSTFTPAEKGNCVGEATSGPLPSYTDLVTCLEMARTARELNAQSPTPQSK
jgi:hypothetical protein